MTLRTAVKNEIPLRIKYYPDKDGQQRVGWRTVLPLDLYTHRGQQYCLCWFTSGSSVSGLPGFRLFFVKNIHEMEVIDTTKQQPFAMSTLPKFRASANLIRVQTWHMVKTGKIE